MDLIWKLIGAVVILCIIMVIHIAWKQTRPPVIAEGFKTIGSQKRNKENFLATSIKNYGTTAQNLHKNKKSKQLKEKLTNITSNSSKHKKQRNTHSALNKLITKGVKDEFADVSGEIDMIDLESISIHGLTDTIKRYNENFNNRLEYARKKNNTNDMEMAMAQWDILSDEFKKLFMFSDYM
jgi:hypothetical protein